MTLLMMVATCGVPCLMDGSLRCRCPQRVRKLVKARRMSAFRTATDDI